MARRAVPSRCPPTPPHARACHPPPPLLQRGGHGRAELGSSMSIVGGAAVCRDGETFPPGAAQHRRGTGGSSGRRRSQSCGQQTRGRQLQMRGTRQGLQGACISRAGGWGHGSAVHAVPAAEGKAGQQAACFPMWLALLNQLQRNPTWGSQQRCLERTDICCVAAPPPPAAPRTAPCSSPPSPTPPAPTPPTTAPPRIPPPTIPRWVGG